MKNGLILIIGFLFAFFCVYLLCCCGGEEPVEKEEVAKKEPKKDDVFDVNKVPSYCGDYKCDEDEGEDYWNCIDCVDLLTGGPKHGYCGDGICFNETMTSCWRDCRPRPYNPNPDGDDNPFPSPFPEDKPKPPIPLPDPVPPVF